MKPKGVITLSVQVGENEEARDVLAMCLLVNLQEACNDIVGSPFVHDVQGVLPTCHWTMLYVSNLGTTAKLRGNQKMENSCYLTSLKQPAIRISVKELSNGRKHKRA